MNPQIKRILEEAPYEALERLEDVCLSEGRYALAAAIDGELRRRRDGVADSVRNIIEALDDVGRNEEG